MRGTGLVIPKTQERRALLVQRRRMSRHPNLNSQYERQAVLAEITRGAARLQAGLVNVAIQPPAGSGHLVQWLLPLRDNKGVRFPPAMFADVRQELIEAFGGVTAYPHSPALGLWEDEGEVRRDESVLFEVLVDAFDPGWWSAYRDRLCRRFSQEAIQIRVIPCSVL